MAAEVALPVPGRGDVGVTEGMFTATGNNPYAGFGELCSGQLRDEFKKWMMEYNGVGADELEDLERAERECGASGMGGYYLRVLECICRNSTKLSQAVVQVSEHSGFVNLYFSLRHLQDSNALLLKWLLDYPVDMTTMIDDVLKEIIRDYILGQRCTELRIIGVRCSYREHPTTSVIRDLCASTDVETMVCITGVCLRLSSVIPEMHLAVFRCTGKASRNFQFVTCGHEVSVSVVNGVIEDPVHCDRCGGLKTFVLSHDQCVFSSKQVCKLQELPSQVPEGEPPQMLFVTLYDHMVDICRPGDILQVIGVYRTLQTRANTRTRVLKKVHRISIDAFSVIPMKTAENSILASVAQVENMLSPAFIAKAHQLAADPSCYETLVRSFAPDIWGLTDIKKGLLCQLFGGVTEYHEGRLKSRGEVHVLLCGDPAVAKSQLLRYINKISNRSVYVVGRGTTSAGLTASLTRDPETKDYVMESGAVILSDGGVCCIDEFDKMNETTRAVLHEVMEQQTVSFAKAGIVCSLVARTAILASANPVGSKYDTRRSVVENINLPASLMSRFDLIFLCLDIRTDENDAKLSQHICNLFGELGQAEENKEAVLSPSFFSQYVAYARAHVKPMIKSEETKRELVDAYVALRSVGGSNPVGTPRQLDSLIRLAAALARMELKEEVLVRHVKEASRLIRAATYEALTDSTTGRLDFDQLTTGKSAAQRVRERVIVNKILALLSDVIPDGLTKDALGEQVEEYLTSQPQQLLTMMDGVDPAVLSAPLKFKELSDAIELLERTGKIGPIAGGKYTFI